MSVSVGIGAAGYHYFAGLPWIDALLNAAMILTGMGPVDTLKSPAAKLFATFYALYSGVAFLSMTAVLLAPSFTGQCTSFTWTPRRGSPAARILGPQLGGNALRNERASRRWPSWKDGGGDSSFSCSLSPARGCAQCG